jgi:feruloyl esterase
MMLALSAAVVLALAPDPASCEGLAALKLPNTTITSAQAVAQGPFTPPNTTAQPANVAQSAQAQSGVILASHCRVAATVKPSGDSEIKIEVWLPEDTWNGKFEAVGNGGWAGTISYPAMADALREGYATASTDTGHVGATALFAIGHPEKLTDFAYRAVHEMTVHAKLFINAYYGRPPRLSYWNGCSTGGRQGLMSAQRFPEDFDAIVAGAPANFHTHLHAWDLSVAVPVMRNPAAVVPPIKLEMVTNAVVAACDAKDGLRDGLISNPRACSFDITSLACKGSDAETCLTGPQVDAMSRAYKPARTSNGQVVFPGVELGSEYPSWSRFVGGLEPAIAVGSLQVAHNDPKWDALTFDVNRDLPVLDSKVGMLVDAVNPDLKAFKARGGKLLLYHGWNDTNISPGNTIGYYDSVLSTMGGKQDDFVRLFMAPGMQHCGGGRGPNQVNWMAALERWRELNQSPTQILASRIAQDPLRRTQRVDMTRPLCPYPQVAIYRGTGSTNDGANFVCKAP